MSDPLEPKDIDDRMLEAALEVTLGGQAGDALEQRILEAATFEAARSAPLQKKSKTKKGSPKSKRRKRVQPSSPLSPLLILGGLLLAALLVIIVSQSNDSSKGEDPAKTPKIQPPAKKSETKDAPKKTEPKEQETKKDEPPKKVDPPKKTEPEQPPRKDPQPPVIPPIKPDPENPKREPDPLKEPGPRVEPGTGSESKDPIVVASIQSGKRLQWRKLGEKSDKAWRAAETGQKIYSNTQLRSQSGAGLMLLSDGSAIQFDGELALSQNSKDQELTIELLKKSLHIDNGSSKKALTVAAGSQKASLSQGNYFIHRPSKQRVLFCCFDGQLKSGELTLEAGQGLEFRGARPGKKRSINGPLLAKKYRFLRGLKAKVLLRQDFQGGKPEALTEGQVRAGKAFTRGPDGSLKLLWGPDIPYRSGMTIRFRVRLTKMRSFYFQLWAPKIQKNWRKDLVITTKQWVTLEFPLNELHPFKEDKLFLQKGTLLRNLHFKLTDKDGALFELDWVELLRRPALIR